MAIAVRIFLAFFLSTSLASGAVSNNSNGVTIITHGFQVATTDNLPSWASEMAEAISQKSGGLVPIYYFRYQESDNAAYLVGQDDIKDLSYGAVIVLDWSKDSGIQLGGDGLNIFVDVSTGVVGDAFFNALFGQPVNGKKVSLLEFPLHFIGHSRGASVNSRIIRRLAENGVIVDQVTSLDPHPVNAGLLDELSDRFADEPMQTPFNVVYADNYWRDGDGFNGEHVSGAVNFKLNEMFEAYPAFPDGCEGRGGDHTLVHIYYTGTVDETSDSIGECEFNDNWYLPPYPIDHNGYGTSRKDRSKPRSPEGLTKPLGGSGAREPIAAHDQTWPNAFFKQEEFPPAAFSKYVGEKLNVPFYYASYDSDPLSIQLYIDDNTDPHDDSETELGYLFKSIGFSGIKKHTAYVELEAQHEGENQYLLVVATDGTGRRRHDYILSPITVKAEDPSPASPHDPTPPGTAESEDVVPASPDDPTPPISTDTEEALPTPPAAPKPPITTSIDEAPAPPPFDHAVMQPLDGTWVGTGRVEDKDLSLRLDIDARNQDYRYAYTADECGGRLIPIPSDATKNELKFKEQRTFGDCDVHDEVTVSGLPMLFLYSWLDPIGPVEKGFTIKRGVFLFRREEPERVEVLTAPTVNSASDHIAALCDGRTITLSTCQQQLRDSQRVAAGLAHSLAVKANGTVVSWGSNKTGQLGDGTLKSRSFAAPVVEESGQPLGNIVAVAAGSTHSLALTDSGEVLAWGAGALGKHGRNNSYPYPTPVEMIDASGTHLEDVISIAAVGRRSFALTKHGLVYQWGRNTTRYPSPVKDSAGNDVSGIVAIAAGDKDILMLKADGTLLAWRDIVKRKPRWPEMVLGADDKPLQGIVATAAGRSVKLALRKDGVAFAWTDDYRKTLYRPRPLKIRSNHKAVPLGTALAVAAKGRDAFVLLEDGKLVSVPAQQLLIRTGMFAKPAKVTPPTAVTAIVPGRKHHLILGDDGRLYTWGSNDNGELGNGSVGAQPGLNLVVERTGLPLQLN